MLKEDLSRNLTYVGIFLGVILYVLLRYGLASLVFFVSFLGIFAILCLGLNMQWGYTGLFNIGVAAFFAVGAYTSAILTTRFIPPSPFYPGHWGFALPWIAGFVGAILVSAFLGVLIALPTVRLRADYLAIATLGLAEIIRLSLIQSENITAGTVGLRSIPTPSGDILRFLGLSHLLGNTVVVNALLGLLIGLTVLFLYLFIEFVGRSPWGRVLKAIREDEDAAVALGKNAFSYKVQAFVLGAAIMGAAGSFFGSFLTLIEPLTTFTPIDTFFIWVMVILGGSGNNRGVVLGALLVWGFQFEILRTPFPGVLEAKKAFLQLILLGVLVILVMLYRPRGLMGEERVISKTVMGTGRSGT